MKKEFEVGAALQSNTEYFATKQIYHIYYKDTVSCSDEKYISLRAEGTPEFNTFVFIKDKNNITIDFNGATLIFHGKIQPFLVDNCENITIKLFQTFVSFIIYEAI